MIYGCGNVVLTSPHTASCETLLCATQIDAKRASSVGFCLVQLTLNLGQDPLSPKMVPFPGPGVTPKIDTMSVCS